MTQSVPQAALKVKREQLGISARQLSARLGKSPSYVSKVESGEIELSITNFAEMVKALGLSNIEVLWLLSQAANGSDA